MIELPGKALFVADLHLKHSFSASHTRVIGDSYAGLTEVIRLCEESEARSVILGGDIFDRNVVHPDLLAIYREFVDRLREMGVAVLGYAGNHDIVHSRVRSDDRVSAGLQEQTEQWLSAPGVINIDRQVFKIGTRVCLAMAYTYSREQLHREIDELVAIAASDSVTVDTIFLHQMLKGCGYPKFNCDEDELPECIREGFIGDVHLRMSFENQHGAEFAYPGALFPQQLSGQETGAILIKPITGYDRLDLYSRPIVEAELEPDESIRDLTRDILSVAEARSQELPDYPHLNKIRKPIVRLRYPSTRREELEPLKSDLEGRVFLDLSAVYAESSKGDLREVDINRFQTELPSQQDLLLMMCERLKEQYSGDPPDAPLLNESVELAAELLSIGEAGRRAGEDELRPDGRPLAWSAVIDDHIHRVVSKLNP